MHLLRLTMSAMAVAEEPVPSESNREADFKVCFDKFEH